MPSAASNANLPTFLTRPFLKKQLEGVAECSGVEPRTCVHDPLDFDAGVVQLLCEGVHSLQQVLAGLRVDVGPPRRDLN